MKAESTRENLHCIQSEIDQFIHDLDRRRYANKFGLGDYDLSDTEFQFLKEIEAKNRNKIELQFKKMSRKQLENYFRLFDKRRNSEAVNE